MFGTGVETDFAPATNFKTPITNIITAHVADNSGTNAPDALWNAYSSIAAVGNPTALNVIVFFTDGVATTFSGTFNVTQGPCRGSTATGVAQTYSQPNNDSAKGLLNINVGVPPIIGDEVSYQPGCGFDDSRDLRSRIASIPIIDAHGTSVFGPRNIPFTSGGAISMRGRNIKPIADNLSVNTAIRARQDPTLRTTIYAIGMGGTEYPADHELLRMISNDPASIQYSSSEPTGLYVYAPDSSQLRAAFRRVASQVTRLIN